MMRKQVNGGAPGELKRYAPGFESNIVSNHGNLELIIPAELAHKIDIKPGQALRVIPIARKGLLIRKMAA
jgi:hypothetical protein